MNENEKKLVQALGGTAEMALIFFRAARGAGATKEEATALTQAYIGAVMFGKGGMTKKDGGGLKNEGGPN